MKISIMSRKLFLPALLLLGIAVFQFFTMPEFFYPGDNFAPKVEAAHWLKTGQLGMPFEMKRLFGGSFTEKGQYFYEDDARQIFTSKYGIGNTFAYIVPTLAEQLFNGSENPAKLTMPSILFINLWQILFTLGAALYFYLGLGLYTSRPGLRVLLTVLSFYTTYVWYYLRSPALEIYQIMPFLASCYHMIRYIRSREEESSPRWGHLAAAISYGCILVWLKSFFVINCLLISAFAVTPGDQNKRLLERILCNIKTGWKAYAGFFVFPALLLAAVVLVTNDVKFGSPLNTGYRQWTQNGIPHDHFSLSFAPKALNRFFIKPGNANIFLHYPLLIPALFSLPLLWKRRGQEKVFLAALVVSNLAMICTFRSWSGEWCYGPRYLLHLSLILTLPLGAAAERFLESAKLWIKLPVVAGLASVLIWSFSMQIYINSLHYFTYHYIKSTYKSFKQERILSYFTSYAHRGRMNADLIAHKRDKKMFPPQKTLSQMISPQHRNILQQLDHFLAEQAKWNYYFSAENRKNNHQKTK